MQGHELGDSTGRTCHVHKDPTSPTQHSETLEFMLCRILRCIWHFGPPIGAYLGDLLELILGPSFLSDRRNHLGLLQYELEGQGPMIMGYFHPILGYLGYLGSSLL